MKVLLTILFSFMLCPAFAQRGSDTFRLYFDLNIATLNKNIEKKIDLLIYNDKIINGSNIMIVGYADYLGSEGYNKNLSLKRAKNIKDYLVKYGINATDIKVCLGEGEVERAGLKDKAGFPTDRRVDIVILNKIGKAAKKGPHDDKPAPKPRKDTVQQVVLTSMDDMTHLKPGSTFLLKNVYFPPGRHIIDKSSYETLHQLYDVLKNNPTLRISIEGHVCCVAPDAPDALDQDANDAPNLSINRAKAIYNYLVGRGIDPQRLTYIGYAKRRPIVRYEKTEEDAEKNRRVEIRITENK